MLCNLYLHRWVPNLAVPTIARGLVCWGTNLGCVSFFSFSGFHISRHLIYCTDWTVMLISGLVVGNLFFEFWIAGNSRWGEQSRHNSTIKLLIQNSPISFQDNTAISLHCTFQSLIFGNRWDIRTTISQNEILTNTHNNYCMPPGLCPPRHNDGMFNLACFQIAHCSLYYYVLCFLHWIHVEWCSKLHATNFDITQIKGAPPPPTHF